MIVLIIIYSKNFKNKQRLSLFSQISHTPRMEKIETYMRSISSRYYSPTDLYAPYLAVIGEHRPMSGQHLVHCFTKQDAAGLISKLCGLT